jgi:hypothetical protein
LVVSGLKIIDHGNPDNNCESHCKFEKEFKRVTTMAAWSEAGNAIHHPNTWIVGSNPTRGMDICVCLFCVCVVLCVGSGVATG